MSTPVIQPEVRLFLARVRAELADLDPEECREITEGLEADLSELVTDRGAEALGDPVEYALELRAAAGLSTSRARVGSRDLAATVDGWIDVGASKVRALVDRVPGDHTALLAWLRPAWWILRAWVAVQLGVALVGYGGLIELIPGGIAGAFVLAAAIAGSVQLGRGKLWPGGGRGVFARVVLVGLNAFAIVVTTMVLGQVIDGQRHDYGNDWNDGYNRGLADARYKLDGALFADGHKVTNIYPYDAQGRPIAGVQLYDQRGRPVDVEPGGACPEGSERDGRTCLDVNMWEPVEGTVFYPWTNGRSELANVFPMPSREQKSLKQSETAFDEPDPPVLGPYPLATVPEASAPGIESGVVK